MALLLVQLGPYQWAIESRLGRVSRETEEPEVAEMDAATDVDDPAPTWPTGFSRNPDPTSPAEEDPDGLE
ncbi:hypothetical protein SEA_VROOMVROOM_66 [Arthrobacter phage VroomVroom]|uniref:Uncharacterized protein n=1 Tax=Arthrobacter phage VroomVroom TaxID=3049371 RepID=A0AA49F9Q0_9CAUD|nr:hypothetical protein SEA_VROOMVROOM_66 [Arthrobacter phage VroomVroom]